MDPMQEGKENCPISQWALRQNSWDHIVNNVVFRHNYRTNNMPLSSENKE